MSVRDILECITFQQIILFRSVNNPICKYYCPCGCLWLNARSVSIWLKFEENNKIKKELLNMEQYYVPGVCVKWTYIPRRWLNLVEKRSTIGRCQACQIGCGTSRQRVHSVWSTMCNVCDSDLNIKFLCSPHWLGQVCGWSFVENGCVISWKWPDWKWPWDKLWLQKCNINSCLSGVLIPIHIAIRFLASAIKTQMHLVSHLRKKNQDLQVTSLYCCLHCQKKKKTSCFTAVLGYDDTS